MRWNRTRIRAMRETQEGQCHQSPVRGDKKPKKGILFVRQLIQGVKKGQLKLSVERYLFSVFVDFEVKRQL